MKRYGADVLQLYALTAALGGGHGDLLICPQGTGQQVPRPGPGGTDFRVRASFGSSSNDTNKTLHNISGFLGPFSFSCKEKVIRSYTHLMLVKQRIKKVRQL
jgi:hypothetical protein